jgi:hypothetical protein
MLARDAADEPADVGAQRLMELATLPTTFPPTFSFSGVVGFTKAAAKALSDGSVDLDALRGPSDGRIVFGPMIPFDFDNRDGITGFDFETAAVHEIGHLLGFLSIVDSVEAQAMNPEKPPAVPFPVFALDLFRFVASADGRPDALDFTQRARELEFGVEAMFDDIDHEFRMSTGRRAGDGRQASHWKADELTRVRIGVLDPTLAPGDRLSISAADLRALDLMGYELAAGDALPAVSILANGAAAGPTVVVPANQPIQFGAQVSDADGLGFPILFAGFGNPSLVSFFWDFGGRAPVNGALAVFSPSPQVRFDLGVGSPSESFPVSLTGFDSLGDATTRTVSVIASEPPDVSFTANGDEVLDPSSPFRAPPFRAGQPVQLAALAADEDGLGFPVFRFAGIEAPITYLWDFGGAKPSTPFALFTERPLVTFELDPGEQQRTFRVSLTVFDALGLSTTRTASITIQRSGPPFVNLTVDGSVLPSQQTALEVGDQLVQQDGVLQLGSVSFDEDGLGFPIFASFGNSTPVSFVWNFGGGVPENPLDIFSPSPRVRFPIGTQEGATVTIALTVFDAKGQSTTRVLSLLTRPTPR